MRVFVTGATGFIGRRVVHRLLDAGHSVVGLTRAPEGVTALESAGAEGTVGDLLDAADQTAATLRRVGPEVVVHLAAETATQRRARLIWEVGVEGTRRLVQACLETRRRFGFPNRFVLAGTVVVGEPLGAVLREDAPLVATTMYGRAKLEAERICFEAQAQGLGVTVLRPSHVYGAGGWFGAAARELGRGRFFVPGAGDNLWDLVHVDDVADAFARVVELGAPTVGRVYHVVDDTPTTLRAFFDAAADALGVPAPRRVPVWLARIVAGRGPIAAALRSARSCNARLKSETQWRPRWPDARLALPSVIDELNGSH